MTVFGRETADRPDPAQPRILITRLSAIGDCVQTLPVAWALRERFPRAFIAWAVEPAAAPLVAAAPPVDRIIVVPKRMLSSPAAAWQVRSRLLPLRFDLAIDPQALTKSSSIGWLSGAKRRIGFAAPGGREISSWLNNELVASSRVHMVERYLDLLRPLGIHQPRVRFDLRIDAAAEQVAAELASRPELAAGFAVVNPGAGWDSKRWPAERFAAVVRQLGREFDLPSLVVWGGDREKQLADRICADSDGWGVLAPPTSLPELAAVMKRARLMVAADTGPLQLAAAVGTPCVGLFGTTRSEVCRPYGPEHIALQTDYDGSAGRKLPGADNWAVRGIEVAEVIQGCGTLLSRQVPSPVAALVI
jgi:ADP-heptose:LPS heptosyltransferase